MLTSKINQKNSEPLASIFYCTTPIMFLYRTVGVVVDGICQRITQQNLSSEFDTHLSSRVSKCLADYVMPKIGSEQCCNDVAEEIFTALSGKPITGDRDCYFPDSYFIDEIKSFVFQNGNHVFLFEIFISDSDFDNAIHSFAIEKIGNKFKIHQSFAKNYSYSESFTIDKHTDFMEVIHRNKYFSKEYMIEFLTSLDRMLQSLNKLSFEDIEKVSLDLFQASILPTLQKYPDFHSPYLLTREAKINPVSS